MGKAPSFQFYPSDWMRDLTEHSLEIEGAWIRICCVLFWSETKGSSDKTLTKWSRILRVGEKKSQAIIAYLDNHNIADVINQNGSIRITSRRMVHDEYIRKIRVFAGSKGGNPYLKSKEELAVLDNQALLKQNRPSSSSSSSSSSLEPKEHRAAQKFAPPIVDEIQAYCQERKNKVNPQAFFDFYQSKGWMVGKNKMKNWQAAVRTWEQREVKDNAKPAGRNFAEERERERTERLRGVCSIANPVAGNIHRKATSAERDAALDGEAQEVPDVESGQTE